MSRVSRVSRVTSVLNSLGPPPGGALPPAVVAPLPVALVALSRQEYWGLWACYNVITTEIT